MPSRLWHPHINARVLTVFALVSLPLIALVGALALGAGRGQLRSAFGLQLSQVAEQTASAVDAYMYRRVLDVSLLGRVPTIRAAAARGSAETFDAARVRALDRDWQSTGVVPPDIAATTGGEIAAFLRDVVRHDPIEREILLADRYGRLVAASNVTTDYDQSDEDWWRQAYGDGVTGQVSVTDVRWDESAGVFALEIAVPVPAPGGEELAGVLKVAADIREMLSFVAGTRPGLTGECNLVRPDGSIVFDQRGLKPGGQYFAAALLRENLQTVDAAALTYRVSFTARDDENIRYVVGVAPSQLGVSYPALSWLVSVSQAEDELFQPVRTQATSLLVVLAVATAVVLLFALWFSMTLAAPPFEEDMRLVDHPKVSRIAEEETP